MQKLGVFRAILKDFNYMKAYAKKVANTLITGLVILAIAIEIIKEWIKYGRIKDITIKKYYRELEKCY